MSLRTFTASPLRTSPTKFGRRVVRSIVVRADGSPSSPIALPSGAITKPITLKEAMSFAGPGPELINGRLAMLGVLGAIGAELATGESVLTQFGQAALPVLTLVLALSGASLAPILRGANMKEAFGPLTPQAEKVNGRVAMLAVAALIAVEISKGSALL